MSTSPIILAIDAQGGDHGPEVVVPAALDALEANNQLSVVLSGRPSELLPLIRESGARFHDRIDLLESEDVIAADARPIGILRRGQDSSLGKAMNLVASGGAQACVSAGNTVALMTLGVKILGVLPGIIRPALMSQIPAAHSMTGMLDLGANLNVDASQLVQFAFMGSIVQGNGKGKEAPRIGLLNVGHEDSKGHSVVRDAHELLQESSLNYQGFIEGHDIYEGKVNVAVCDGFTGNLILKSSEGLAGMLIGEIKEALGSDWKSRMGALLARPALRDMLERLDPAKHNGAPLLGLDGVVVKSHGRSGRFATTQAILEAVREVQRQVPERIAEAIRTYGEQQPS